MKRFRLFVVLLLAAFSVATAAAQTGNSQQVSTRFAVIDTVTFGDTKNGIAKYVTGMETLRKEFEPIEIELKAMGARYENLRLEIEKLRDQVNQKGSPIPPSAVQLKIDEYGKLAREIQFKDADAKARYQSRFNSLMAPVLRDISKAVQDYARQKGYAVIFDAAKLDESGLILGIGDEKVDVTKDFIAFYNARPATGTQK